MKRTFLGIYECGGYYYKAYKLSDGRHYVQCINDASDWAYPSFFEHSYKKVEG